jgi:hypothetical protein
MIPSEERTGDNMGGDHDETDQMDQEKGSGREDEEEFLDEIDWVRPVEIDEEDDVDADAAAGRWTALARFVSRRRYNARTMFDELGDVWRTEHKLTYKDLGDNLFQLDFYGEADYNFVIKGGTWHHRHDAVIVVPF